MVSFEAFELISGQMFWSIINLAVAFDAPMHQDIYCTGAACYMQHIALEIPLNFPCRVVHIGITLHA